MAVLLDVDLAMNAADHLQQVASAWSAERADLLTSPDDAEIGDGAGLYFADRAGTGS